jgi:hypothetical protein
VNPLTIAELKATEASLRRQAAKAEDKRLGGQNSTTRLRLAAIRNRLLARADDYRALAEFAEKSP